MTNLNVKTYHLLEDQSRDEYYDNRSQWDSTKYFYHYLEYRTSYLDRKGNSSVNKKRLQDIEKNRKIDFPCLTPEDVDFIYEKYVIPRVKLYCSRFTNCPFFPTTVELESLGIFRDLFKRFPKIRNQIDFILKPTEDGIPEKMLIGMHIPDLFLFGLKLKNSKNKAVAFEINGSVHTKKFNKDMLLVDHASEMGIDIISLENWQVSNNGVKSILYKMLKNGDLTHEYHNETNRNLELRLKLRAISCWIDHEALDKAYNEKNNRLFNSKLGFESMIKRRDCPREIKTSIKNSKDAKKAKKAKKAYTKYSRNAHPQKTRRKKSNNYQQIHVVK